jgi:hypothetical protein
LAREVAQQIDSDAWHALWKRYALENIDIHACIQGLRCAFDVRAQKLIYLGTICQWEFRHLVERLRLLWGE